jgi:hypothetical protein
MHAEAHTAYRAMKNPARPGQLRTKTWKALWMGDSPPPDDDPTWAKRCKEYWELQEKVYGLVLAARYTVMIDVIEGQLFVTTAAVVDRVLPGPRV